MYLTPENQPVKTWGDAETLLCITSTKTQSPLHLLPSSTAATLEAAPWHNNHHIATHRHHILSSPPAAERTSFSDVCTSHQPHPHRLHHLPSFMVGSEQSQPFLAHTSRSMDVRNEWAQRYGARSQTCRKVQTSQSSLYPLSGKASLFDSRYEKQLSF